MLFSKYIPLRFEDVCGQNVIVDVLKRQVETGEYEKAYLFCGNIGVGKKTLAKVFNNELNKQYTLNPPIFNAYISPSKNELVKFVNDYTNFTVCNHHVIIIEEANYLSEDAWKYLALNLIDNSTTNIFIIISTNSSLIPKYIYDRVMCFNFINIPEDNILLVLKNIVASEKCVYEKEALKLLACRANGNLQKALELLKKLIVLPDGIILNNVLKLLEIDYYNLYFDLTLSILLKDERNVLGIFNYIHKQNIFQKEFFDSYIAFCLDLIKYIIFRDLNMISIPQKYLHLIEEIISNTNKNYLLNIVNKLVNCGGDINQILIILLNLCNSVEEHCG